jgi:hypothetical protein
VCKRACPRLAKAGAKIHVAQVNRRRGYDD